MADPQAAKPPRLKASPGLGRWLADRNCSIAVSAYQSGLVLILGSDDKGNLTFSTLKLDRAMGMAFDAGGLWIATLSQVMRFVPVRMPPKGDTQHDTTLLPQVIVHTGYMNAHDLSVGQDGRPLLVSSLFNCLMRVDLTQGVEPVWSPPFISELVARDCCHLNGIAVRDGRPQFATALGTSGAPGSWKKDNSGGCLIDVGSRKIIAGGLCMPHSPRLHQNRLWLHNSGRGAFGYITAGTFKEVSSCRGYPRGLAFLGEAAILGVSKIRTSGSGTDLPVARRLEATGVAPTCGIMIVAHDTGQLLHEVIFGEGVEEIFDIAILSGTRNPKIVRPGSADAARSYLLRLSE
jgi:uncharacterized protein (TIGR03032 family)